MLHALIYHGWPINTSSAAFERQILHSVANQIDAHFPNCNNLLINGTWLNWNFQHAVEDLMIHYEPQNVFISSLVDPWNMDQWAIEKFPRSQIYFFGNTDNHHQVNFWALYCNKMFPEYSLGDIGLRNNANKLYLCYQNKTNRYRDCLYSKFQNCGLLDHGYLTYWDKFIGPGNLDSAEKRSVNKMNMEHDTVGNLETWQSCLINIVSETEHAENQHTFVSEKTWKAIIGFRPFIINGDPRIYAFLRNQGFKTFDQWFPVKQLENSQSPEMTASIISKTISDLVDQKISLKSMFNVMRNDLMYNKNRFREFVVEQTNKIHNLFTENGISKT